MFLDKDLWFSRLCHLEFTTRSCSKLWRFQKPTLQRYFKISIRKISPLCHEKIRQKGIFLRKKNEILHWNFSRKKSKLTTFLDYALQLIRQNNRRNNPNPPNENENRQHRFKLADLFDENFFDNMKPEAKQRCVERLFEAMFVCWPILTWPKLTSRLVSRRNEKHSTSWFLYWKWNQYWNISSWKWMGRSENINRISFEWFSAQDQRRIFICCCTHTINAAKSNWFSQQNKVRKIIIKSVQ